MAKKELSPESKRILGDFREALAKEKSTRPAKKKPEEPPKIPEEKVFDPEEAGILLHKLVLHSAEDFLGEDFVRVITQTNWNFSEDSPESIIESLQKMSEIMTVDELQCLIDEIEKSLNQNSEQ